MPPRTVRRAPAPRRKKTAVSASSHIHRAHAEEESQPKRVSAKTKPAINHDRVLTPHEKRELILAHAEARQTRPHHTLGFAHYLTVAVAFLFVISGWWLTLGKNLRAGQLPSSEPDPIIQMVQTSGEQFVQEYNNSKNAYLNVQQEKQRFDAATQELKNQVIQQEVLKKTAEQVRKTTSSTPDLYQP